MQARHDNALKRMEQDYDSRMEEQVEDLRDKMRLLQVDRKSNIDLLETSKNANKEYIRQLKNENRELRKQLADIKRMNTGASMGGGGNSAFTATGVATIGGEDNEELAQVVVQLNKMRRQHDEVRHRVQSQSALLEELKDEVKDLELESKKPSLEDTPETRKIRILENRLDKAMIKYNEAQSIRKTYEQIVKRLKEERIGFDNQLAAIERALGAKQHDYEELVLLSSDATHAREMILQELEKARSQYEEEKRHREKEFREKQQYVRIRLEMSQRLDKRDKQKLDMIAKESGDLSPEEEKHLKSALAMTVMQQGMAVEEKKEHRSKIDIFESAFRKIKEATGVSDVNEVIQKITSQESTTDNLINLSKENQARVEQLQAEHNNLKARVEELKYSGSGGGHRRKMVDDHEQNLVLASAKLERAKLKYERLAKVFIGVKAGVEHLVDKLECVRDDDQVVVVTDETIVDALQESEMTLVRLLNQIKASTAAGRSLSGQQQQQPSGTTKKKESDNVVRLGTMRGAGLGSTQFSLSDAASASVSDSDMLVSRPYNQRVALPGDGLTRDEMEQDDAIGGGGTMLDDPEEALSRDRVKKASTQVILAQDKKKKRVLKKRVKDSLNDSSDDEIIPGLNGSSGAGNDGNGNGVRSGASSPLNKMLSPKKR
uniref:ODAD1 central coiled coil region domain-containing protein n=1 Tax=Globisporangium ultimum (strain ATCC 200006 / CBS 805.95 / DAOM BR144) TaxID=431595 RepID=K3W817_GLOUD